MARTGGSKYISKKGLEWLDKYKYQTTGYSMWDNIMNHWWAYAVTWIPLWVAPNLVTLSGLLLLLPSAALTFYYAPTFEEHVPSWVYYFSAWTQFMYQTLDAIDGKHARETKASSPLGQLFDHGTDSVATVFLALPVIVGARLGRTALAVLGLFFVQGPFFLAQWEEYHTHMIRTFSGYMGVTEGQHAAILILLLSGYFGEGIWETPLSNLIGESLGWALGLIGFTNFSRILLALIILGNSYLVYVNISTVFNHVKGASRGEALARLIPLGILISSGLIFSLTPAFDSQPWIAFLSIGGAFSHLTTQIIVNAMTRDPFKIFQWAVIPLPFLCVNALAFSKPLIPEVPALYVYMVFVWALLLEYVVSCIQTITRHLGIYCLQLGKRPERILAEKAKEIETQNLAK